jgi:hypothetical protein
MHLSKYSCYKNEGKRSENRKITKVIWNKLEATKRGNHQTKNGNERFMLRLQYNQKQSTQQTKTN